MCRWILSPLSSAGTTGNRWSFDEIPWPGFGRVLLGLALGLVLLVDLSPHATAAVLPMTPFTPDSFGTLEVGDDLWVAASDLERSVAIDLVLVDDQEQELMRVESRTLRDGTLPATRLWVRTGVVGCDSIRCTTPRPLEFADFQEAEGAVVGRTFVVRLVDPRTGDTVAARSVQLVPGTAMRVYFSDADGCPRYRYDLEEDIFLAGYGVESRTFRVFLVSARAEWQHSGVRFTEALGRQGGRVVRPRSQGTRVSIGGRLPAGGYGAVLRRALGVSDWLLGIGDFILQRTDGPGPTHDDGILINDWGGVAGSCLPN